MRKSFCYIMLLMMTLTGCSFFQTESDQPAQPKKIVKDVSQYARPDEGGPRKRLLILPFIDSSPSRPASLRERSREKFMKELTKKQSVILVDNNDLKFDFSKAMVSGEYVIGDIAKQANSIGVPAFLEGKIVDLKVRSNAQEIGVFKQIKTIFDAKVRVRVIASRSAKEIMNTTKNVTLEDPGIRVSSAMTVDKMLATEPELLERLVTDAFLDFIPQILGSLDKLSWEGRIAMINGDRIFLNVGRLSGLQVGDILKVSEDGEEVFDPQTGTYIGKVPGRVKGTLEVVSYFGQDGTVAVIHSGSGFKENDKVELY